jgi:ABC-2 type transport system ATP-binding protein
VNRERDAMIDLQHVTRLYGSVIGVNDMTLSLKRGAYGLIGPNGSGKSTLLNLITGQLRPTLGTVTVFGAKPFNNFDLCRRIGVCPEHEVLYTNVTGLDWVRYLLELHGFGRREALARAERALDEVGMATAMRRPMGGYSRGMRQRTKLAQALAHDPELLVLDEPLSGLDPVARMSMTELLRRWVAGGKGLLFASHMLHEVEAITESFLLICGGRLLASGTAEEVDRLLAEVPREIRIRCDDAAQLAHRLVQEKAVDSIRFAGNGEVLIVSTRSPTNLYTQLPAWTEGTGIRIRELQSADESLQRLFDSLLQIHRGAL